MGLALLARFILAWDFFAARAGGGAGLRPCAPPARAAVLQVSVLLKSVCGGAVPRTNPMRPRPGLRAREAA